jgi:serine protease AprX
MPEFFVTIGKKMRGSFFVPLLGIVSAWPGLGGQLSPDLRDLPPSTRVDVVVQFKHAPDGNDLNGIAGSGGRLKKTFKHVHGAVITVPVAALHGLISNPNVTYISLDRKLTGTLEFAEPTIGAATAFQFGWTGYGVGVAVIDSGIDSTHPDLQSRVVYSENFVDGQTSAADQYGHGTHVAGIVGGNAYASAGPSFTHTFRGIAPKAGLINLRALDGNGQGTDSSVISALDRAIDLQGQYGIRVVNLSVGRGVIESYTLDPLCQAVEQAWMAGLVVVVAAGNSGRDNSMNTNGYGTITSPGIDPYVITVGAMKDMSTAMRADDLIASYSSKGPTLVDHIVKPDLVAPGNGIISAQASNSVIPALAPQSLVPISYYKVSNNQNYSSTYLRLSGTSMATPMVSGAAALLLQQQPGLTPDQVKARLMKTASKGFPSTSTYIDPATGITYTSTYDLFTVGAGYLDVWAALNNTDMSTGTALSPTAVYDPASGSTSLVVAPDSVWNDAVIWGTAVVWGTNVVVNGSAVVWGTAVIWGTSSNQGFAVIWGTAVVWGTSQPAMEVLFGGDR